VSPGWEKLESRPAVKLFRFICIDVSFWELADDVKGFEDEIVKGGRTKKRCLCGK
jgi:hypothetical protein